MSSPFVVQVARLLEQPGQPCHQICRGVIEDLSCSGSRVAEDAECEADVIFEAVTGGVSVSGTVSAAWYGTCRRCLALAEGTVRVPVQELFAEGGDGEEAYPLWQGCLDLAPMVHDAVLLQLPQAPLCRPGCLGLCQWCGNDRNEQPCACEAPADPRWSALDEIRPSGGLPD